jgi:hypothetical protein
MMKLALFNIAFMAALAAAQTQPQNQPAGSMSGMDMSQPASSSQPAGSAKQMNMGPCMMNMGSGDSKQMDMGKGSGGKQMDMSNCMGMMRGAMDHGNAAAIPPGVLRVAFGDKSTDWTAAQLVAMPQTTVTVINEHTKANDTYTGVPVTDLLTHVGVSPKPHGKDLALYLVFVGSDGYEVVFSTGELAPYIHDAPTIVADTENGKPLAGDGPLKLISSGDKMPERWVRNLVAIHVLSAE